MKQKKKKDEPPPPPSSAVVPSADEQQQLCNGGDPAKKPKKSALKRTATGGGGSSKAAAKSGRNKRRVQFNESLNVFFESDYVIVIRDDDCDFDEEDFDFWSQQPCSCGDASCFQPWLEDDDGRGPLPLDPYEEQPGTLSPPDGYKDGCSRHVPPLSLDHLKYDDDSSTRYNSDVVDRCSDTHVTMPLAYNSISYFEDNNQNARPELTLPTQPGKDEQILQQPPSTNANTIQMQSKQNAICDKNSSTAQQPRCIVETITMTTVTERQIVQETGPVDVHGLDGAKTEGPKSGTGAVPVPDDGYVLIKCGNNTMLYNNRNPNSAVRQLFPATKFVCPPTRIKETDDARLLNKYLITEESLRAFDSRSLNGGLGVGHKNDAHYSDDDDDDTSNSLIRRTIERSTLRRNTARKKPFSDTKEMSLIEKIRRLTCDSDDDAAVDDAAKKAAAVTREQVTANPVPAQPCDLATQPCTAVQAATPAYKKLADLFSSSGRYEQPLPPPGGSQPTTVGGDPNPIIGKSDSLDSCDGHSAAAANSRAAVRSAPGGKPFLSTLATACVTGNVHPAAATAGGTTVTAGTSQPSSQCPQPDVVAGTQAPGSHHRHEELAAFVQQDSGRLEKIRKRYMPPTAAASGQTEDEDDENDDYGFNRRPEVHGIRSGFSAQIAIKNNQKPPPPPPPQRPRSYYGEPACRQPPPPLDVQPDFVPVYPAAVGVRTRFQGDPRAPPPYPAASQRSIIRVTHGQQQQTIRVPYQAVGPVQVHLLTTATTAATSSVTGLAPSQVRHPPDEYVVQHGRAHIHHGQQFVIARGTQTAACISTTRYYQLPPPPPLNHQPQQSPRPQPPPPPPPNFRPADDCSSTAALQFKQLTSPTRGIAPGGRRAQQEFAVDRDIPAPSAVSQTPKNPVLFYGMNV